MGTVWMIILAIQVCSLLFFVTYLKRFFRYYKKYRMPESKYTLLWGGLNVQHIVVIYTITLMLFIASAFVVLIFTTYS